MGAFERWDGQRGPGNRNAARCMDRAIQLARAGGMGCVALRNTNHWMRGGAYGLRAAASNCLAICWSNAVAAMPAWGGQDSRLGTNPLVLAAPGDPPVLADVSMSQFSYGRLQEYRLAGRALPVPGGYGPSGLPTDDPAAIEATRRVLPIGLWKGSALATVLDLMAAVLSDGHATVDITTRFPRETGLSQVFLAFSMERLGPDGAWTGTVERLRAFIHASVPAEPGAAPRLPGERAGAVRATGDREGIPVDDGIWAQILAL
jgi:3-dehydro-L-gulonate 2-dehydrogenase